MQTTIKTTVANGKVSVSSPYNSDFVTKARALKGTFLGGVWQFEESVKEHVLKAVKDCYGVDGTNEYPTCILVVTDYDGSTLNGGEELFGRPIAKAWGRDSGARIGDDVFFIKGKPRSGGSVKNWKTVIEDAEFEIHNYPVAALQRPDVQKGIAEGWVTVKGLPEATNTEVKFTEQELIEILKKALPFVEQADELAFPDSKEVASLIRKAVSQPAND